VDRLTFLLRKARSTGLTVAARDGHLMVRGPRRLANLANSLLADKEGVLAALRLEVALAVFPGARVTIRPPEPRPAPVLDPFAPTAPMVACRCCRQMAWRRAGDGWTCDLCDPDPQRLAQEGQS